MKNQRLDKTFFDIAEPHKFDRHQSIDSQYIREGINLYKQSLRQGTSKKSKSKKNGLKGKNGKIYASTAHFGKWMGKA